MGCGVIVGKVAKRANYTAVTQKSPTSDEVGDARKTFGVEAAGQDADAAAQAEKVAAEEKREQEDRQRECRFMGIEEECSRQFEDSLRVVERQRLEQLALVQPLMEPILNYVVLLMGQTGSGKTSLLNLIANLDMAFPDGSLPSDLLRKFASANVSDMALEADLDDLMASKTSDAQAYSIKLGNVSLTVVDTPGFGDSRGLEVDEAHVKRVVERLETVGEINCVLLTINGRESRLNTTLKYVLSVLTSVMPRAILGNLAVVFTNTANERQLNFKLSELESFGVHSPPFVCVENPICSIARGLSEDSPTDLAEFVEESATSIRKTLHAVASLFGKIAAFDAVPTLHFKEVFEKREAIELILTNTYEKYQEQTQRTEMLRRVKNEIMRTGEVTPEVVHRVEYRLKESDSMYCICHAPNCHSNCFAAAPGSLISTLRCTISDSQPCKTCGCRLGSHKIAKSRWQGSQVKDIVNLGEMEAASTEKERRELAVRTLEDQIAHGHAEKDKISAMLFDKLEEFSSLGIPDAYKRLLQGQFSYIQQLLELRPDDTTLIAFREKLEVSIKELETSRWRAPVPGARQKLAELVEFVRPPPASWQWQGGMQGGLQPRRIRVPEMDAKLLDLLRTTPHPKHPKGCSGQDGGSMWLGQVKGIRVWRLEHPVLWQQFANTCTTLRQQFRVQELVCPPLDPPVHPHEVVDASVNEVFLWHGTKAEILPTIREWGLDERVCSLNGLHGGGLYFASESCKAGQYAPAAGKHRYLLYTRVLLGTPFYTKGDRIGERRPPVFPDRPGKLYDSVVANAGVANAGKQYHREFVVYDRRQTYPEFEVELTC
eukprot:TRINITY_DN76219_c0_g1_i1.p1 TRINITY_DN76219_c0_g1~~TRINITY_DN76219_c0_g1_i1.p1  ORF type:complete len:829 (-),score=117.61 TRINITY_DN76219_c0_g1_i1:2-2488(-)